MFCGGVEKPHKKKNLGQYKIENRSNDLVNRSNKYKIRSNEMLNCSNKEKIRSNDLVNRSNK